VWRDVNEGEDALVSNVSGSYSCQL